MTITIMKNYKSTIICLLSAFAIGINANAADNKGTAKTQKNKKNKVTAVYKDANAPIEARVEDLLSRMTTEEKIMQLNQYTLGRNNNANNVGEEVKDIPAEIGSLIYFDTEPELRNIMQRQAMEKSRLGIPVLFGHDVIHGFKTIFPIPLAQACTWNPQAIEAGCAVAAQEARMSGVDWTFSPMVDVAHDPRWGRVAEGYGEDPFASGIFGAAAVKGYQGSDLTDNQHIAACLKHYVGYGASEAGRDYVYTEISRQTLWDTYLQPFKRCVEAGAVSLMSSFNDISGTPGSANKYTMTTVLRDKWKFNGFVVSDWGAIEQLCNQGLAKDKKMAGELAINAGLDMDMMSHCYDRYMKESLEEGKISMATVDEAVRRVLRVKFMLGLFEHPYTAENKTKDRFFRKSSMEVASQVASESMVLLKNDKGVLPITDNKRIAVVGPLAKTDFDLLGCWRGHGHAEDVDIFWNGLEREFKGASELRYAKGCDFDGNDEQGFKEAVETAKWADVVVLFLGERSKWSGENTSRSSIALPEIQHKLLNAVAETGKPVVLVLSNGRPLELCNMEPKATAIVEAWQPGINGANALAGILSGRINPSGRLAITFPYSTGQIPIYYNRRHSGRGHQGFYHDITSDPMYPFAHGLSYTTYEYGELNATATKVGRNGKMHVEIPVKNTGKMDGQETVFWFIRDPWSNVTRPVKELRHFEKRMIKAGETEVFAFDIDVKKDFGYPDEDGNQVIETGDIEIIVKDKKLTIEVTE